VHRCPAFSRFIAIVLRSARALFWSAIVTGAHAQLLPPRREESLFPNVPTPPAIEVADRLVIEPTAPTASVPHFTQDLFTYLNTPDLKTSTQREDAPTSFAAGLVISGGQVIGLTQDKHWFLGIGTDRLAWAGSGGFAAYGKDRTVIVHGDTYPLVWGKSKHFIGESDVLVFGATDSDATLIWHKKIDLGKGERTIRVVNSLVANDRANVRFDQGFVNGDLIFEGSEAVNWASPSIGRADLSAANNDWQGNLTVRKTELHANLAATLRGLSSITVEQGGRFVVDNLGTSSASTGGSYLANRLSQFTTILLNSGTLAYWGRNLGHSAERTGIVELLGGANIIDVVNHRATQSTVLTIGGMYRDHGATLNLTNSRTSGGSFGTAGNTPQLKFRDNTAPWDMPEVENGIIPWATVNGTDFATLKGKHLVAYTDYNVGHAHTWNATTNASPNADQYLSTDHIVNSLRLTAGRRITLYGNTKLTLNAGALLSTGTHQKYTMIEGGQLAVGGYGPQELYVHEHGGGFLVITSNISQAANGGLISLTKTGRGALSLSGHDLSALTGTHHINEGSVFLRQIPRGIGIGGHIILGNRGLHYASLLLTTSNVVQHSARITLRGTEITIPNTTKRAAYRSSTSTLQVISGSEHTLESLTVDGSGVLFFGGPAVGSSLIALEHLTMTDSSSQLFVEHWRDSQTHLLIRRAAGAEIAKYLGQIQFTANDSSVSSAKLIDYNTKYFEIVPTWFNGAPEPAATGAILGAGTLGFFAWRRRRVRNK